MSAKATTSGRPARVAQPDRERAASGKSAKPVGNGHLDTSIGKNASSMRNNQPPAIRISMQPRTGTFVDLATLPAGVCLLDTEAKMLKCMQDLLPLTSGNAKFTDNTRWSASSRVADVFHSFFTKVLELIKAEFAKIVIKDGTYKIAVKEPVYFDVNCPVMPVYWILALEGELFDLCFFLIVFLNKKSGIGLWGEDQDGYIYENIESCLSDLKTNGSPERDAADIAALEEAYVAYGAKGVATLFGKRLERSGASRKLWLDAFARYEPKTVMARDIYKWLKLGKELVLANENIHRYISLPEEIERDFDAYAYHGEVPETPDAVVKFLWRVDDPFFGVFESMVESFEQNQGAVPFYVNKIIERASDLKGKQDCFPEKVLQFMAAGRELEKEYRAVFASPDALKKRLTPQPKKLIDIL